MRAHARTNIKIPFGLFDVIGKANDTLQWSHLLMIILQKRTLDFIQ